MNIVGKSFNALQTMQIFLNVNSQIKSVHHVQKREVIIYVLPMVQNLMYVSINHDLHVKGK